MSESSTSSFEGIGTIHVTSDAAGIQVVNGATDGTVGVELVDRRGRPLPEEHLELVRQGNLLDVHVRSIRGGRWRRGRVLDARLRITAPLDVALDVRSEAGSVKVDGRDAPVSIAVEAGAVQLDRINGSMDVRTQAGAIRVQDSHGDAQLRSDAGAIHVERQHGGTMDVRTSAGAIDATELHVDHVRATTDVGVAKLRFERPPTTVDASCSVGSVEVALPREQYRIDHETGFLGRATVDGLRTDPAASRTVRVAATGMGTVRVVPTTR